MSAQPSESGADKAAIGGQAAAISRGTLRLLARFGFCGVSELSLSNNRRADIAALGPKGEVWMIEIKSSVADFRADSKWPEYLPFCDRLFFAVGPAFPQNLIPAETGLIVADGFDGAILRDAPEARLSAARRKAVTLRFARRAATRLMQAADTDWTPGPGLLS